MQGLSLPSTVPFLTPSFAATLFFSSRFISASVVPLGRLDCPAQWFADCAARGSALCRQLHSTKVGGTPGITEEEASRRMIELNVQAADGGSAYAAIKIARAHLKLLPSSLPFDLGLAERYFRIAIESSAPDGHYGMAQILLTTVKFEASQEGGAGWSDAFRDRRVQEAIAHLERAAFSGHAFSQFNLGLVHTFGYHGGRGGRDAIDVDLAGMWFERSGIPEGFMVAAGQAGAAGQKDRERRMVDMARSMGYFEVRARLHRIAQGRQPHSTLS